MMSIKIDESWGKLLTKEFDSEYFKNLISFVKEDYSKTTCYPKGSQIFNAFDSCPVNNLKVVIIGQDPYHGPGQAHGLSFSVESDTKIPPSLMNIYKELNLDLNISIPRTGNLQPWADEGVLLLNTILTVEANQANSHKGLGWEKFTKAVIKAVDKELESVVFMLWGRQAQSFLSMIDENKHYILCAPHPSPLSVHNGFFGCKHFSKANEYLKKNSKIPINWTI